MKISSPRLEELKRHRRRTVLNKILFFLLGLLALFGLLAYLSNLRGLKISDIEISGNKIVDSAEIKSAIEQQVSGKYIWLFPKDNMLYYPRSAIEAALREKFKRLDEINLSIGTNKILSVSVSEREPKYTWCGNSDVGRPNSGRPTSESCYFMDASGYIFDEAPYFSGSVYFKFYGDDLDPQNPLGNYFSKQNFRQLVAFKDTLADLDLNPAMMYVGPDGEADIYLAGNNSAKGPEIKFTTDADFQNLAENLQAALSTEPLQSEFKTKYSKLEYLDLRFGNKVYYKFSL